MTKITFQEDRAVELAQMIQGETTFTAAECRALFRLARQVSGCWVEVGSWCGRSFVATALGLKPGSQLVAVDPFEGAMLTDHKRHKLAPTPRWVFDHFLAALHACEDLRPDCRFDYLRTDSVKAAKHFSDDSLEAVFIDADHRYEHVRRDLAAWLPKVKPGGLVAGHDYWPKDRGVVRAVDERFDGRHELIPDTRIWLIQR